MYGDGKFEASLVSKERASDASPHRLRDVRFSTTGNARKPAPDGIGRFGLEFLGWVRRHNFVGLEWGKKALHSRRGAVLIGTEHDRVHLQRVRSSHRMGSR